MTRYSKDNDLRLTQIVQEFQHLKDTEDEIIDVQLVLESLNDTVESLSDNYADCVMSSGQTYTGDHDIINRAFQTQLKDIAFTRKNMQSLHTKLQGTRTLLSGLQAMQKCAFTRRDDKDYRRDAAFTPRVTGKGVHDPPNINVLTLGVLFYLPIVVVCVRTFSHFSNVKLI